MQGSIAMLKDVQAAMADHATLQQHLPKKEWLAAVPVLLRLANKCDTSKRISFQATVAANTGIQNCSNIRLSCIHLDLAVNNILWLL